MSRSHRQPSGRQQGPDRQQGSDRQQRSAQQQQSAHQPRSAHQAPPRSRRHERSQFGGRHELGQNFLVHDATLDQLTDLVADTRGTILEIGPGDGALTGRLAGLGRPVVAVEIDESRVQQLRRRWPHITVDHSDAMRHPLRADVVVGNLPFHLTTPLLRRLLGARDWHQAVLVTQWEVARKRAGVGGSTMLTAQTTPWFEFDLRGRVPAAGFRPRPSVDGGILHITRRRDPLIPKADRSRYAKFVHRVFNGRGGTLARILQRASGTSPPAVYAALDQAGIRRGSLPRDLTAQQWASIWFDLAS